MYSESSLEWLYTVAERNSLGRRQEVSRQSTPPSHSTSAALSPAAPPPLFFRLSGTALTIFTRLTTPFVCNSILELSSADSPALPVAAREPQIRHPLKVRALSCSRALRREILTTGFCPPRAPIQTRPRPLAVTAPVTPSYIHTSL